MVWKSKGVALACAAAWAFLVQVPGVLAQQAVDLRQAFLDLHNDRVLMDLSAHPDDEDGATLAYYRMDKGVKTCSILFTRGEGGQNAIGPELYEELGVLRSAETKAAASILESDVRFLNFKDFGFSKTATETFRMWGGQREVLRRLVYMIRKLKPDVLFTNHNTINGHGNHQAVAITALWAFDAAADPSMFPEQLKEPGIDPWQPRKLYFRVWGRDTANADVRNDVAEMDPLRHRAYIDIATEALRKHRTQGLDRADLRGFTHGWTYYMLMRTNSLYARDSSGFFSGVDPWESDAITPLRGLHGILLGLRAGTPRDSVLQAASRVLLGMDSLESSGPGSPLERRILQQWRAKLQRIVELECNFAVSMTFHDPVIIPGEKTTAIFEADSKDLPVTVSACRLIVPDGWSATRAETSGTDGSGETSARTFRVRVGDRVEYTLPKVTAQYRPIDSSQNIEGSASLAIDNYRIPWMATAGVDIAPPEALRVEPAVVKATPGRGVPFTYTVRNFFPHKTAGRLSVTGPAGWFSQPSSFTIADQDSTATGTVVLVPPRDAADGEYRLEFSTDYARAGATARVFGVRVAPGIRVGVIKSYDTTLEEALKELGVPFDLLDDDAISSGDLSVYATILIDIRAYLVRDVLGRNNARLLAYVKNGGNLVVMYQRQREWKPEYAPYPFQITNDRITMEDAPVTVLIPDQALLSRPNRITAPDWDGWVQERAVYMPGEVPPEYQRLLSSEDTDEPPLTTGYLVAHYGSGSYIYTSYVWYRELKEANPGAYRCFANMISYPSERQP